ncbi:MAG: hypothetical protein Unbinned1524contig1000_61 [Prokaryotic dsDNA virus sp.]|nr:MAG: hypothetical protein Unbinned1524contig1000_61 [Prokaryotic dsDNA virus sp.]|tara:strand:- start:209 stop:406 length:198 start_codon:yes stop_codon:yes gene_type:complete
MSINKISVYELERIEHINYITNEIHTATDELYESFMDKEYDKCRKETKVLIKRCKEILESLEDEI